MITSNLPYLRFAMERYFDAVDETVPLPPTAAGCDEWVKLVDRRWQGVQCAIFHATRDVNDWDHCRILGPCSATFTWIDRLLKS